MQVIKLIQQQGQVDYYPDFLAQPMRWYEALMQEISWQEEDIFLFGQWRKVPRLMAWYGDENAYYRYSGVSHEPIPWTPTLRTLKTTLEEFSGCRFNSVLANFYRDGKDSMGWHSDDEKELGENPCIASLSLGGERRFLLKHKQQGEKKVCVLASGSLLLMQGALQHYWQHALPKTQRQVAPRINLTFRWVNPQGR